MGRYYFVSDLAPRSHQNIRSVHAGFITADAVASTVRSLPVSDIERKVMPRAGDYKPFQPAFDQRSAFMGTTVVNRIILAVNVEQRDGPRVDHDHLRLSGGQFIDACNLLKSLHTDLSALFHGYRNFQNPTRSLARPMPKLLHTKRVFKLVVLRHPCSFEKSGLGLNNVTGRGRRGTIEGTGVLRARFGMFQHVHNVTALIDP